VITLGLSEVWFDRETELVFAEFPGYQDTFPLDRLRLDFLDSEANFKNLDEAVRIIHSVNPLLEIILTVSPIPLRATYFNRNVTLSNTLSKNSLLEAAIGLSQSNPKVHYFPAYEIALMLNQAPSFDWDGRHVTQSAVNLIMEKFQDVFVK
jgi:hypothetical protein